MKISFKVFLDTLNIVSQFETPPIHLEIAEWLEATKIHKRAHFYKALDIKGGGYFNATWQQLDLKYFGYAKVT